jgi:hypothetical protein
MDFLSLAWSYIALMNTLTLARETLSLIPDYTNRNQIGFWWDGRNEITVKRTVLNGNNHTCRHAKIAMIRYIYAQINLLEDAVENTLNNGCAGGKPVLQTGVCLVGPYVCQTL